MLNMMIGKKIEAHLFSALQGSLSSYKQSIRDFLIENPDATEQEIEQMAAGARADLALNMRFSLLSTFESISPIFYQRFQLSSSSPTLDGAAFHALYRDAFYAFAGKEPKPKNAIEFAHKCNYLMSIALQQLDDECEDL